MGNIPLRPTSCQIHHSPDGRFVLIVRFLDWLELQVYDTHSFALKGLPNLPDPEFLGHTLLVFRPFILYNRLRRAQVGA